MRLTCVVFALLGLFRGSHFLVMAVLATAFVGLGSEYTPVLVQLNALDPLGGTCAERLH